MRMQQPQLRKARIEIVPMIDTIFFLLVFFMVTWLTMVKMNGLSMILPRHTSGTAKPPFSVVLSLSPSGKYYLDSRPAEANLWGSRLRRRLQDHPNAVVVVNVAAAQKTQTLISLLDSVNQVIADSHTHAQVLIATPRAVPSDQENAHGK